MKSHSVASLVLKLVLFAAGVGNTLGNLAMAVAGDVLLSAVGVPASMDPYAFAGMCCLSFTMGVAALFAALDPDRELGLVAALAIGKASFAAVTLYFHATRDLHPFWLAIGATDGLFAVAFLLQLVRSSSPDLASLQQGALFASLPRQRTRRALLLGFSLTGTGRSALERLKAGLERTGYRVDVLRVRPLERIFRFPLSLWRFLVVSVRAILRVPARIAPVQIPAGHDYDLVVVQAQTWLVGTSAPVEAIFQDPYNLRLFAGRDAVALVVARGAYRRNVAMLVRWLQAAGANVVGARGFVHQGAEPTRLMRLWAYLIAKGQGSVQEHYGLSASSLDEIERLGEALGRRVRLAPPAESAPPSLRLAS